MKKILITGGSGFVGKHLVMHLLKKKYHITVLSRNKPKYGVEHLTVTEYTPRAIDNVLKGYNFDCIIHLVGAGSAPTDRNILMLTRINAILPGIIVESAARMGAKGVVMAGSYAEYAYPGKQELLTENHPLEDNEPYGTSKAAGGEFALAQGEFYGIPVAVGRLFNIYGPHDTLRHRLLPSLIDRLKYGKEVPLSLGKQYRDFVYVKDACEAIIRLMNALTTGNLPSGAYNICSSTGSTIADFAIKAAHALGVDKNLLKFGALPPRPVPDAEFMVGDATLLNNTIGWKCSYSLEEGLQDCMQEEKLL